MAERQAAKVIPLASRRKRPAVAAAVVALGFLMGMTVAEVAGRVAFPLPARHYVWPPNATLEFRPDLSVLPGASPVSRYAIDAWGVRGRQPAAAGEYRVLFVGASAVECVYLDQPKSFPALVEQRLTGRRAGSRVWVGNAGKSGLNTRDHVVQVQGILSDFRPIDLVVAMTGVNDLGAALRATNQEEALRPTPEAELLARAFYAYPERWARAPAWKRSGFWRLARRGHLEWEKLFPPAQLRADWSGRAIAIWREHRKNASRVRDELPDLAPWLARHREDVLALIDAARGRGARILLVTQPALWRADLPPDLTARLWLGGVGPFMEEQGHEYYSPAALAKGLEAFNGALLAAARERGAETLDLAGILPREADLFFDDCHFTETGSARVADILAAYLSAHGPGR